MENFDPYDFGSLETPIDQIPEKTSTGTYSRNIQHPCESCAGTGLYRHVRVHQEKEHCFACRGKGYFLTSAADRKKARSQRLAREQSKKEKNLQLVEQEHPGLIPFLESASAWSDFAASVLDRVKKYGPPSEKVIASISSMRAKCEAREAERQAKRKAEVEPLSNLDAIFSLFANATGSGLKKPRLTVHDLTVSKAPEHGANAGALYLKIKGDYAGKITPERELKLQYHYRDQRESVTQILSDLSSDPLKYATEYGRETGVCCCCNKVLTDPISIAAGIGPICAGKWGLR